MADRIRRIADLSTIRGLLRRFPVVALLGARQVGKTTLAKELAATWRGQSHYFDLEQPSAIERLRDPETALAHLRGLVVLDEVQCRPDIFPVLRALVDRARRPARFLVLGSASPHLLRQTSESLAGRVAHHELQGLGMRETGVASLERLWLRGGFPASFIAADDAASLEWRREFTRTFLDRDIPQLGIQVPPATLRRLWTMLAHRHGQVWNASEFGRSFGASDTTIRRWLDILASTYVVRQLPPWHENLEKRQVKSPKVYIADTGMLHALLNIESREELENHPSLGASWEWFAIRHVLQRLDARQEEAFFWATHAGAELDLLVVARGKRYGFEVKRTVAPGVTKSMKIAMEDLKLDRLDVVHAGEGTFPLSQGIRALALRRLPHDLPPLRGGGPPKRRT